MLGIISIIIFFSKIIKNCIFLQFLTGVYNLILFYFSILLGCVSIVQSMTAQYNRNTKF